MLQCCRSIASSNIQGSYIACLRNPWKCLNFENKIFKALKSAWKQIKLLESPSWKVLEVELNLNLHYVEILHLITILKETLVVYISPVLAYLTKILTHIIKWCMRSLGHLDLIHTVYWHGKSCGFIIKIKNASNCIRVIFDVFQCLQHDYNYLPCAMYSCRQFEQVTP